MAVSTYKCPNCGGDLVFDPQEQKFKCEYCDSIYTEKELDNLNVSSAEGNGESDTVVYICPSCGAEIVTDATTAATFCYYCHNPVVLSSRVEGEFKPDYVIPFKIEKDKAEDIFSGWMKKKKFVPDAFYSQAQIDSMTGVYFPYLLYSCCIDGKIDVQAVKIRNWTSGNIRYTETANYHVVRDGKMTIDHISRNALKKANRKLAEAVLPYDMDELKEYHSGYLSGFMAEKRDMDVSEFQNQVDDEVADFASKKLEDSMVGYSNYHTVKDNTKVVESSWHYALFPVWTVTYNDKSKNKIYYFSINGQSGKVCGELPTDSRKLALLFAKIFVPVAALLMIAGYLI